jgi:hypothetical protein
MSRKPGKTLRSSSSTRGGSKVRVRRLYKLQDRRPSKKGVAKRSSVTPNAEPGTKTRTTSTLPSSSEGSVVERLNRRWNLRPLFGGLLGGSTRVMALAVENSRDLPTSRSGSGSLVGPWH